MAETSDAFFSSEKIVVELTGADLTVDDVVSIAREGAHVRVHEDALRRVVLARQVVERVLATGEAVYGLNTALGSLFDHRVALEDLGRFAFATVADQTASYGRPISTDVVRAMMGARANSMAKAGVGVRRELVLLLVDALNAGVHPIVRQLGSVGQGDLYEMADIGKVLIGLGRAEVAGRTMPGREALAEAGLEPIELAPKEALALISANGVTLGHGALVLNDAADLLDSLQVAAALSLEGFAANLSIIHPGAAQLNPQAGPNTAAGRLRDLLADSYLWRRGSARNLQDPLSFRCVPQTHGALYDVLAYARLTMEGELNSASDNPLVLVEDEAIVSVGNFDVVSLAMAFDLVRIGIANAIKVSNERVQKLVWRHFSGLEPGLAPGGGPTGGLRPLARWCAALSAEARGLANPVSLDYEGQVAEGVEDHASMAPLSVRRTSELVSLAHRMVAHELIIAAQAVDRRGAAPLGRGTTAAYEAVRECVPTLEDETRWDPDLERLIDVVAGGRLGSRVAADAGERQGLSDHEGPGPVRSESV